MAQPHDRFFKLVFGDPANAAEHFGRFLPEPIASALDFATLRTVKGSFVDESLRESHTDLLFSVRTHDESEVLVHLLFEHQSTVEPLMAYRVVRYMTRIWDWWLDRTSGATGLPPIIPMVLYHGERRWTAATELSELLEAPESLLSALGEFKVRSRFVLMDLSKYTDEELRSVALSGLARLVLKHAEQLTVASLERDVLIVWRSDWFEVFRGASGLQLLAAFVEYVLQVTENPEPEDLRKLLTRVLDEDAGGVVVTTAERLIEKGLLRGRAEGRAEAAGRLRSALRRLMEESFGPLSSEVSERLDQADGDTLSTWVGQFSRASSAEQLVGVSSSGADEA